MIENVAVALSRKIEIGVLSEINDGVLIGGRGIINLQLVCVRQRVDDFDRKVSRIAFFAIFAQISQFHRRAIRDFQYSRLPHNFVEAFDAAVEVILAVVDRQLVFDAVECEAALSDAIAIATDNRTKVRTTLQVSIEVVEAEHDVVKLAVAIRDLERGYNAAVVDNPGFDALAIS